MQDIANTDRPDIEFLTVEGGRRIAVSRLDGASPGVIFFGGLRSDMTGAKALHVETICRRAGRACTRFDYSGHGQSDGDFEDGTISRWLADARVVVDKTGGERHVFVGSSLGGWLALLLAMEKPDRVSAVVGISVAVDFTRYVHDVLFADAHRKELADEGRVLIPDCHGGPPFAITRDLIEDGRDHLLLDRKTLPIECPVRLICARHDKDIPWDTGLRLADKLKSPDVQVTVIKDGEHQLARPSDLQVLQRMLTPFLTHDLPA
jgi:pimeloyl-ACP methyl ester carboxylesterase